MLTQGATESASEVFLNGGCGNKLGRKGGNGTGEKKGCGPWRISGQGCCFPVECPVFDPRVRGGEKPIHWIKGGGS